MAKTAIVSKSCHLRLAEPLGIMKKNKTAAFE